VAAKRVGVLAGRDVRFEGRPHDVSHFGVQRAHDERDLHLIVVVWVHPTSNSGQTNDRRMVTPPQNTRSKTQHLSARALSSSTFGGTPKHGETKEWRR
jgi:hypothetical protein